MPELPEVETVCRGLAPIMTGRVITRADQRRPDLRRPFPPLLAQRLEGKRIIGVRRRAKYILVDLDNGYSLLVHLGMSGRMMILDDDPDFLPGQHDHFIIDLNTPARMVFHDPRRFGLIDLLETACADQHELLRDLGPEPLGNHFNPEILAERLQGRKSPIKTALLDQHVVVGLGNIYVCEALFHARIDPRRLACSLSKEEIERLVPAIRSVLEAAISAGGSSLRDYVQASGELGYFQNQFAVYDCAGKACPDCHCALGETGGVQRIVQANRSTYFCPVLQQ